MEKPPHIPIKKNILRSVLVILWWVSVWGIAEIFVHQFSNTNPIRKMIFYGALLIIVLGVVSIDPTLSNHV